MRTIRRLKIVLPLILAALALSMGGCNKDSIDTNGSNITDSNITYTPSVSDTVPDVPPNDTIPSNPSDTNTHSGFNQIWFYSNSFEDTVFVFIDSINYRYSCSVFNNSDYCLQFWNMESGYFKLMNDTIHLYGIWGQKDYLLREIDSCSVLLKYIGYINMQNYPIIITDYLFTNSTGAIKSRCY